MKLPRTGGHRIVQEVVTDESDSSGRELERSPIRSFTSYVPEISPAFVSGVGLPFQFWLLGPHNESWNPAVDCHTMSVALRPST